MALIKCSECGADISDKAEVCPKCGCPLEVTKQVLVEAKEQKKKDLLRIGKYILLAVAFAALFMFVIKFYLSPEQVSVRLIKKDFGKNIKIERIYYNSEVKGCIVKFQSHGKDDTATIHLKDKTVGYYSVLDELIEKSEKEESANQKKEYEKKVVDYLEKYEILWDANRMLNEKENGWKQIK